MTVPVATDARIDVQRAAPAERELLQRMLELYQHDLSDLWDQDVDGNGTFGYALDRYWSDPDCTPYLFRVDGQAAGFALVDKPPTGFRRDLIVEHNGEHRGTLDIKKGGFLPIVDLARSAALAAGVSAASTSARLDVAEAAGTIPAADVSVLRDAFDLVIELRMQHQIQQLRAGQAPDNHIDPATLTPLVRTYLREAFRAVSRVQQGINTSLKLGTRRQFA